MNRSILSFVFLLIAIAAHHRGNSQKKRPDSIVTDLVAKHQIVLTNAAYFKNHRSTLKGASAFLINYQGQIFAVTARHLLGEAGGVIPEVTLNDLNKSLVSWRMFPRVSIDRESDTITVNANLNYDHLENDILFLNVTNKDFNVLPLGLSPQFPKKGDEYFIIGCPYEESDCKQNLYPIRFKGVDLQTSTLTCTIKNDVNLAGFSGAPIVDAKGLVVGVVVSGWDEGKKRYVSGTLINEVERIRAFQK